VCVCVCGSQPASHGVCSGRFCRTRHAAPSSGLAPPALCSGSPVLAPCPPAARGGLSSRGALPPLRVGVSRWAAVVHSQSGGSRMWRACSHKPDADVASKHDVVAAEPAPGWRCLRNSTNWTACVLAKATHACVSAGHRADRVCQPPKHDTLANMRVNTQIDRGLTSAVIVSVWPSAYARLARTHSHTHTHTHMRPLC
jgi:hypothetical protein